ncbi:MAG: ABC transporter ATP-binding protein [Chlamydiae bacterium]|nr:MAG: ABC transporter ATP-binding protein [Chlamydiota bacterium]
MIKVNNLVKRYGEIRAVDDTTFTVKKGEIVGLLGPNGAGKTTTMRIITCFMPATSGSVTVAGYDVFSQSLEVRRHIGYMPENVPLYPEMRINEYLRFRAKLKGLRGQEITNRVAKVIDACDLGHQHKRIIEQLSKGNRQRVGLADALVGNPELLILDEPTIGLDPNQVRKVRELIREIGRDRTVVLSTHILSEVEMICKKVIIMYNGKIAAQDSVADICGGTKKQYICEVKTSPQKLKETVESIQLATNIISEPLKDGWAKVVMHSLKDTVDLREQIFNVINQKGWTIRELDVKSPTLEETFVNITSK